MVEHPIIAKLTLFLTSILPAIFGSIISLKFTTLDSTLFNRFCSFLSGVFIAHYIARTVIELCSIAPTSVFASSILFVTALFGVSITSEIYKQLPELIHGVIVRLLDLIKK